MPSKFGAYLYIVVVSLGCGVLLLAVEAATAAALGLRFPPNFPMRLFYCFMLVSYMAFAAVTALILQRLLIPSAKAASSHNDS